ncbi:MAG: class I SAM-dependent methyltransferase [Bryobacterales bacterium]|nr:class I SAM-dependent methyltransferase [Bryobacterales bacterium]
MATSYDEILYPTSPQHRLHLDNFYLCAKLNGYEPVRPESARLLEIGCGSGFNLIPMALEFPHARFVGVDYAARPIEVGVRVAEQLGVRNLELRCADVLDPNLELGEFDYISAHGLYSWVPPAVRDALWRLVARSLAPQGIFHVSFNALPGWYTSCAVRDFLQVITAGETDPMRKLDVAWNTLGLIATQAGGGHMLADEAARIRRVGKEVLFHDELGEFNEPFYLSQVTARAGEAGLRYVAEADLRFPHGLHDRPEIAELLRQSSAGNVAQGRQLLDFFSTRRFHDALFTWQEHVAKSPAISKVLASAWAYSDVHAVETSEDGTRTFEHSGGVRVTTGHPLLGALADALEAASPASIQLGTFWTELQSRQPDLPQGLASQFWPMVVQLLQGGVIRLRLRNVEVACEAGERPCVTPFTRMQARWDRYVANAYHASSAVPEPWQQALFTLLDGTRDRERLAADLARLCWEDIQNGSTEGHPEFAAPWAIAQAPAFLEEPARAASQEALRSYFAQRMEEVLTAYCRGGYLVPV